jgi:hypothetical protein
MWNEALAERARVYQTGVLTVAGGDGFPSSVRCRVTIEGERIVFAPLPPYAAAWRGRASLLFHRHNDRLEDQHELMAKGEIAEDGESLIFALDGFVTGTGSATNDEMPHAGAPLDLLRFMLLGRKKAKEYLAKRGKPWPPVPFDDLKRAADAAG